MRGRKRELMVLALVVRVMSLVIGMSVGDGG